MVRKPIHEMGEEDEGLPQPDDSEERGRFEALTSEEFEDLNALFDLLNSHSYETVGEYSMRHVPEDDRKVVTFNAVLPSSNDWDPATAYRDDE